MINAKELGDPDEVRRWANAGLTRQFDKELEKAQARCLDALFKVAANSSDEKVTRAWARLESLMQLRDALKEAQGLKNE